MPAKKRPKSQTPKPGDFAHEPQSAARCIVRYVGRDWLLVETEQECPIILDQDLHTGLWRVIGSNKPWRFTRAKRIKVRRRPKADEAIPSQPDESDGSDLPLLRDE